MHRVTLIEGDGIGPEVVRAAVMAVEATGAEISWEQVPAGEKAFRECGNALPPETVESVRRNKVALKGPLTGSPSYPSPNVGFRRQLGLYVSVRPISTMGDIALGRAGNVDVVVIRDTAEGLYNGVEMRAGDDAAVVVAAVTRQAAERLALFTASYVTQHQRKLVTMSGKPSVLRLTDGLFVATAADVLRRHGVPHEAMHIDALCYSLAKDPERFDTLLMGGVYGDIVSDLAAGLVGTLGLAPGAAFGEDVAIFEPGHGTAPKYAGQGVANPSAMILCASLMLDYLGEKEGAEKIIRGVRQVLAERRVVTHDLGGMASTGAMGEEVARVIHGM